LNDVSHLLSSGSFRNSQRDTEDGVGTELSLVWSSIKLDQELIDLRLILDIDVLLDESGTNDLVDIGNCLENTLSGPLGLITITEFDSLMLACSSNQPLSYLSIKSKYEPVEAPDGTIARWRPVSVTTSTSTVGLPRES
jgi:hypothetical protein